MICRFLLLAGLLAASVQTGRSHAPPTPSPSGFLKAQGARLVDSTGQPILLRGVVVELEAATGLTLGVLRYRWNLNAVRIPLSVRSWQADGAGYLARVGQVVKAANADGLVAVLAAVGDAGPDLALFWRAAAAAFRDTPLVVFSVLHQPPGPGRRTPADWQAWQRKMQEPVDAIRAAGASQVVSVQAYHDGMGFQGFAEGYAIRDANVMYEAHPYYDFAVTDAERDALFTYVLGRFPLYAGEWGATLFDDRPGCRIFARDPREAIDVLFRTLLYLDTRNVSWTAFSFAPGRLVRDLTSYTATTLESPWQCGQRIDPQPGMGELVLLWLTGDSTGFGALLPEQIASAAGGPAGPVAPGEILSIYWIQLGPDPEAVAQLDASGTLPALLGDAQVLFDGEPAPLFYVGPFQVNAQVPYSVAGKERTRVQSFFRGVPSNTIELPVVEAAPEIFTELGGPNAVALNQDGSLNSAARPASPGEIVILFATGAGVMSPPAVTGRPAEAPFPQPALPVRLTIGGIRADLSYAGAAPGFVGLLQINARVPASVSGRAPVVLTVGSRSSRAGVGIWTR